MKLRTRDKVLLAISLSIIIASLCTLAYWYKLYTPTKELIQNKTPTEAVVVIEEPNIEPLEGDFTKSSWQNNHVINEDYITQLRFASGLIDLPVVQGESNSTYLRTDWQSLAYDDLGSIFMDAYSSLEDQNIIIYGHNVYLSYDPSGTQMFTPLHALALERNYETNKDIYLYLKNELRHYEVAYVFYCPLVKDDNGEYTKTQSGYEYYYNEYSTEEFTTFINNVKKLSLYDTGIELTASDKWLTLQTCVDDRADLRLIIIAKEIDITNY